MTDDEREPQHGGTKGCPQKKVDTMEGASQVRKRNYSPRRVQWAKKWGWWADRQPVKSKRRGRAKPRDIEEQYIKLFLGGREGKKNGRATATQRRDVVAKHTTVAQLPRYPAITLSLSTPT